MMVQLKHQWLYKEIKMSLDLQAEKLQAKVNWLKEHLNTKKTAEELDAEFEVWYEEEKVKKEEQEIRDELTAQIKQEQDLWFNLENRKSAEMSYETNADLRITRVCTLQAFANVLLLQSLKRHSWGTITFSSAPDVWCEYKNGRCEYSTGWWSHRNDLLSISQGKYYNSISGETNYTVYKL